MKTVQREPRSTGAFAKSPSFAKSAIFCQSAPAKVCKNDPQPDEQASLRNMLSIAPLCILNHLISCPPMSIMKSTSGMNFFAAKKCAIVSTIP